MANPIEPTNTSTDALRLFQQDPPAQLTPSIGYLLEADQGYFNREGWKGDRGIMVHGLVHWGLLLWNSIWFSRLSCF
jgi:hypothetical protein